jgi:transcriptional regulator with XRE-family HTH domain
MESSAKCEVGATWRASVAPREWRESRGWSLDRLADSLGISSVTLRRWEQQDDDEGPPPELGRALRELDRRERGNPLLSVRRSEHCTVDGDYAARIDVVACDEDGVIVMADDQRLEWDWDDVARVFLGAYYVANTDDDEARLEGAIIGDLQEYVALVERIAAEGEDAGGYLRAYQAQALYSVKEKILEGSDEQAIADVRECARQQQTRTRWVGRRKVYRDENDCFAGEYILCDRCGATRAYFDDVSELEETVLCRYCREEYGHLEEELDGMDDAERESFESEFWDPG